MQTLANLLCQNHLQLTKMMDVVIALSPIEIISDELLAFHTILYHKCEYSNRDSTKTEWDVKEKEHIFYRIRNASEHIQIKVS